MLRTLRLAVVEAERAVNPAKLLTPVEAYDHVCSGATCEFVCVREVYVCLRSWHVHFCTPTQCQRTIERPEGHICDLTGVAHELAQRHLDADVLASYAGQQRMAYDVPTSEGTINKIADAEATNNADAPIASSSSALDEHKPPPYDPRRDLQLMAHQRDNGQKLASCRELIDMLLFSELRRELNEWGQKHAQTKTRSSVAKYMKSEPIRYFEHVWHMMRIDDRETAWCRTMPTRDSIAHQEAEKACQAAVVWWNRFSDIGLTAQCKFEYHALATFYVHATGLRDGSVQVIPAHPALFKALPGMNKLSRFRDIVPCTYTNHERMFRDNVYLWRKQREQ